MKPLTVILCAVLLTSALGCITTPAGLTSSTLPITANDSVSVIQEDVQGADSTLTILGIGIPYNSYTALQKAKKAADADGLINVTAENRTFWVLLVAPIITWESVVIRGDAVNVRRGALTE